MKNFIIGLLLLSLSSGICPADDQVRPSDLLKWLPDSPYSNVSFSNVNEISGSEISEEYRYMFGDIDSNSLENKFLPESMKKALIANCNAVLFKIKIVSKGMDKVKNTGKHKSKKEIINKGERLSILYLEDPVTLVKNSAKKGHLKRTGFKLFKQPVFSISTGSDKENGEGFLWLSPDGFVVLTGKKETLKLVAKTGMGLNPSFLDNSDNARIKNMVNSLGQEWKVRFVSSEKKGKIDALLDNGGDHDKVQALEKSLEEEMVFEILSYELAKEITKIKYMVYEDAETAEKRKNEYVKNLKKINFDLGAGIAKEKSKVKVEKLDEFGLAVSNYVTLALSGAQETVNSQKITQEGDTVISKNTFGEEQYEMRVQKQEAKKIMDEQTKILVAKYKAEHGETQ